MNAKIIQFPVRKKKARDVKKVVVEDVKEYWDRNKGRIAVGMTVVAALFFYANQRNIKIIHDFTHDEDLVGQFEDWMGLTYPGAEDERETPLNWKDLK